MRAHGIDPDEPGAVARLARATGLPERYLYRWRDRTPSFENTMELLERAGMLRDKAAVFPSPLIAPRQPESQIDVVEAYVRELSGRRKKLTIEEREQAHEVARRLRETSEAELDLADEIDRLVGD